MRPFRDDPAHLIHGVPSGLRPRLEAMLAGIGMRRLPPGVEARDVGEFTHIHVGSVAVDLPHQGRAAIDRGMRELRRSLVLARDAEARSALLALAGHPEQSPPAWAWLCPAVLPRMLALSGVGPDDFISGLALPDSSGRDVEIALPPAFHAGRRLAPMTVAVRPEIDRLVVVRAELGANLHVVAGRTAALVARGFDVHAISGALPGRPITEFCDHPALDAAWTTTSCSITRGSLRASLRMPWTALAPLPPHLAAAFPYNPNDARSAIAWG